MESRLLNSYSGLAELDGASLHHITRYAQERVLEEHANLLADARENPLRKSQLREIIARLLLQENLVSGRLSREGVAERVANEIIGYGPIDPLIADQAVDEIMVNAHDEVYVERRGLLERVPVRFRDNRHVEEIINRIVAPIGRRIDQVSPFVDARLPDGSRVNAVIPPLALRGPALTIRKSRYRKVELPELVELGTMSPELSHFLELAVRARLNIVISGGAGSGKTTTLNALCTLIPADAERVITIEDPSELHLPGQHVVCLETRPPNIEGKGEITVRQLVRNALRMRPDRIVIGECRGAEALDMIFALNTGHDGSLSTIHANNPIDAIRRLENMSLMAADRVPHEVVREQIRSAIDLIVHQARFPDGSRKVVEVALVNKPADPVAPGTPVLIRAFCFQQAGPGAPGAFVRRITELPPALVDKFVRWGEGPPRWHEGEVTRGCLGI